MATSEMTRGWRRPFGPAAALADHWDVCAVFCLRSTFGRTAPGWHSGFDGCGRPRLQDVRFCFRAARAPAPMIVRVQAPSCTPHRPVVVMPTRHIERIVADVSECHRFVKRRPARWSARSLCPRETCVAQTEDDIADKRWLAGPIALPHGGEKKRARTEVGIGWPSGTEMVARGRRALDAHLERDRWSGSGAANAQGLWGTCYRTNDSPAKG
jgi:hypothetical protein